jgi:putative membrane protein
MSLGLWIGGLMLFFIIPVKTPQNAQLSRGKIVFGRYFVLGTFGICEALAITGGALLLGVEAVNVPIFMLFACVLSLTFLGIFQLVHLLAGDLVSKAICIIVAIVQIAAAGGTFPVELTSPFFMAIHPYLPLTYSIDGFREIISGGNWSGLLGTTGIFAIILVCAWGLSLLVCKRKTERAVVGEAVEAKA